MDLSSPKTWQDAIAAVIGAPQIAIPLVVLVTGGAWWLRGRIESSVRDGLNGQMGALRERMQLARDQQAVVTSKLETARLEVIGLKDKVSQVCSEPVAVEATANVANAVQTAESANSALTYILRPASDSYAQQWRDHAISAAIIEKIAFTAEYEDGRTARLYVSQWDVRDGDDVVRVIAGDRQREGSLPKGKIKRFKRESAS
jgi:hypothetical protein